MRRGHDCGPLGWRILAVEPAGMLPHSLKWTESKRSSRNNCTEFSSQTRDGSIEGTHRRESAYILFYLLSNSFLRPGMNADARRCIRIGIQFGDRGRNVPARLHRVVTIITMTS